MKPKYRKPFLFDLPRNFNNVVLFAAHKCLCCGWKKTQGAMKTEDGCLKCEQATPAIPEAAPHFTRLSL